MAQILIIDDDQMLCNTLSRYIRHMNHEPFNELTLGDGLEQLSSKTFDVVFLDVHLPDESGLHAIPRIRNTSSSPEVIIITGEGDPDGAELAIESGAWAYIEKPLYLENADAFETVPPIRQS